jgi:hypothetical protein
VQLRLIDRVILEEDDVGTRGNGMGLVHGAPLRSENIRRAASCVNEAPARTPVKKAKRPTSGGRPRLLQRYLAGNLVAGRGRTPSIMRRGRSDRDSSPCSCSDKVSYELLLRVVACVEPARARSRVRAEDEVDGGGNHVTLPVRGRDPYTFLSGPDAFHPAHVEQVHEVIGQRPGPR